jgi:selT/selW/selH-like putative selenoprotein
MSKAVSLADELRKACGVSAKLIPGSDGIFDVVIDGKRIFSRFEAGRFPESGEVAGKLKSKQ